MVAIKEGTTMKRNMSKLIEQTTIDTKQEITVSEIQQLLEEYKWGNDLFWLISRAFTFGYAIGKRTK